MLFSLLSLLLVVAAAVADWQTYARREGYECVLLIRPRKRCFKYLNVGHPDCPAFDLTAAGCITRYRGSVSHCVVYACEVNMSQLISSNELLNAIFHTCVANERPVIDVCTIRTYTRSFYRH